MTALLVERDAELAVLTSAVAAAWRGSGSVVLVSGEAGIGKTALVRTFLDGLDRDVRRLVGTCDDLRTRRTLGPLRDAVRGTGGPLERALADGSADVFDAAVAEFGLPPVTVLVVEDVHCVDDATLDVLRHLARRASTRTGVLVLTYRPGEIGLGHPLRDLLGELSGVTVHRVRPGPLTARAVDRVAGERAAPGLHELTGGNPFFVTEVLAAPPGTVPRTVSDAVLARLGKLSPDCRAACEQLSVVPTVVSYQVASALLGGSLTVLDEAERSGVLQVCPDGLAFRHELARRAVESRLPRIRRVLLNQAVLAALLAEPEPEPDLDRVVHHAVEGEDERAVARWAPEAGRAAAAAGSHRQALDHFAVAQRYARHLEPAAHARLLDDYAWELYNAQRFADAVVVASEAVSRFEALGEPVALGRALSRLSRHHFMVGETAAAERTVRRAVELLQGAGDPDDELAHALAAQGSVLALTGRSAAAIEQLARARTIAQRAGLVDLEAMCLNYLGVARTDLEGEPGLVDLRASLAVARRAGNHELLARGYTNLVEPLHQLGRLDELAEVLDEGLAFARERGFWSHSYNLDVHRCLLMLHRGDWDDAEERLRDLVADPGSGMLYVYSVPPYARLLARRGRPEAAALLEEAWARAVAQRSALGLAFAGLALAEFAWLTGQPERARPVAAELLQRRERAGSAYVVGELLRYLARAGVEVAEFSQCPQPWSAGLAGDWRSAADGWAVRGNPYERALELAESGDQPTMLEALAVLDGLGARAAAGLVRERLVAMGVARVPRGPTASTRSNPAGLTDRQLDVLALLAEGLTNAEIAARLVLSVRTVDHHVAAVLDKLGVHSRRDAAALAEGLDLSR